jgi:hypothetical protein
VEAARGLALIGARLWAGFNSVYIKPTVLRFADNYFRDPKMLLAMLSRLEGSKTSPGSLRLL